jgi:selenocysteine lyase/cysteine desulfurase
MIGRSILVPTVEGARPYINLDNSASTPTFVPIWNAVRQTWRQTGEIQQETIHEVRSICAGVLGTSLATYGFIFTSNTTEAINLAAESLKGLLNFNIAELEQIQSSGEENAGGIAAMGKAFVLMQRIGLDLIREEEQALTRRTLHSLARINGLRIYGINDPASPRFAQKGGVIVFTLKGLMSDKVAKELSTRGGIGVRYGCHCAHILVKHILGVPPSLERFQRIIPRLFPRLRFPGVALVSLGIGNTAEDFDTLIHVLGKIAGKPLTSVESFSDSTRKGTPILPQMDIEQQVKDFVRAAALRVYSQLQWSCNWLQLLLSPRRVFRKRCR